MPSDSSGMPNEKRCRPELTSVPTRPSSRPRTIMPIALTSEPLREHDGGDQAEHHQREVLGRAELERDLGERRREGRDDHRRERAGDERAEGRDGERRAGAALARHLVAVDAGHHRRRLAGQVDQDRGRRAAVLRAVVDAGQHDQRGHRRQRVGDRQQHRDRRHRPDAGQHADQRAEQHAEERSRAGSSRSARRRTRWRGWRRPPCRQPVSAGGQVGNCRPSP